MSAAEQSVGASTTITALKPAPASESQLPMVSVGFTSLQSFELTLRVSKMFAASSIVPEQFQNNVANCAIALEMSQRLGASPLMVMQNLDVIYGRPAWRAVFLIASFNQCGRFEEIQYTFTGKKGTDTWGCIASSVSKRTGEKIEGPEVTIKLAKDEGWYDRKGSKWKTIPQLMLMYRAGSWLIKTHAPEISMGLSTEDEIRDTYEARKQGDGHYAVDLESLRSTEAQLESKATNAESGDASSENVPHITHEAALQMLNEAGSIEDLEKAWAAIALSYDQTDREIEPDIDELYKSRKKDLSKL